MKFKVKMHEDYTMKSNIDYMRQRAQQLNKLDWLQEIDELEEYFKMNPDFYISDQFGSIGFQDSRYQSIFNELKQRGLKPRHTYFGSRFSSVDAITVDSNHTSIPSEVDEVLNNYPELIIWDRVSHKATNGYKIKFDIRDGDFIDIKNKYK